MWNENAEVWTRLARSGYEVYRDAFNTPMFLAMLPPVAGRRGLDIGCGEGTNTRLVAECGAYMTAVDIAEVFVRNAAGMESADAPPVDYGVASTVALPFAKGTFDFATAFMSLMDIPETDAVLAGAYRVLKPGGFLQFSITHPCCGQ